MYGVMLVADHIIRYCGRKYMPISNLKLQKILYFVQAEFLVSCDMPAFPEEIEAWDFGPVVPQVYHRYKIYGSSFIPSDGVSDFGNILVNDKNRIERIVDECAPYSASQLVDITHHQTPWLMAYVPYRSNIISKESIRDFFLNQ